jgi:hypothetical protein
MASAYSSRYHIGKFWGSPQRVLLGSDLTLPELPMEHGDLDGKARGFFGSPANIVLVGFLRGFANHPPRALYSGQ